MPNTLITRAVASRPKGLLLSLLSAFLFTAVGSVEMFVPSLMPRQGEPAPLTVRIPYGPRLISRDDKGSSQAVFEHRRIIVPRGEIVLPDNDDHKAALVFEEQKRPQRAIRFASQFVVHFLLCQMLIAYLRLFGQSRIRLLRTQIGLMALLALTLITEKGVLLFTKLPEFWVPNAALPLWVALVFDRRASLMVGIGLAFFSASFHAYDPVLLTVVLVRGIVAVLSFSDRKHPEQMLRAGLVSGIAGALTFAALTMIVEGQFHGPRDIFMGMSSNLIACVGGGIAAGVLARWLHEPAERMIGHVSRERLLDLTDLEQPLLKKMAEEAPGSWEHARAMANLAEAAASAIFADALLTRVGAYYHDLGKTVSPKHFVENLAPGERSPHDDLSPEESAEIIVKHVTEGTRILREGRIPEPVVEFVYTHHGTQVIEYFWHKYKALHEAKEPKIEDGDANSMKLNQDFFRYPGMKPQTKETAILMLVDSIEAASRTIWPPDLKKYEEMIQRVIFTKLSSGQLDECGLSLSDLHTISERMAATLVNVHHARIKYPWQNKKSDPHMHAVESPPPPSSAKS